VLTIASIRPWPRNDSFNELTRFRFVGDIHSVAFEPEAIHASLILQGVELFLLPIGEQHGRLPSGKLD
jgi:hypothetical protein